MTALVVVLALALAFAFYETRGVVVETRRDKDRARSQLAEEREHHAAERREWTHERHGLLVNIADEQRHAREERTVLLNRIQDPIATAMTSNVMLVPPATSEDLSLEYEH